MTDSPRIPNNTQRFMLLYIKSTSIILSRLFGMIFKFKNYSVSSNVIASTGQFSAAASQHSVNSQASGSITWDFSSFNWKTAGHISAQLPQPIHFSSSTTGFIMNFATDFHWLKIPYLVIVRLDRTIQFLFDDILMPICVICYMIISFFKSV
mgnify:CR=1 FL=1